MVGVMIPIQFEPGSSAQKSSNFDGKCINNGSRSRFGGSEAVLRKPLCKKNSRQKLRTFNIEIQLERDNDSGSRCRPSSTTSTQVPGDLIRKNGISIKAGNNVCVPSHKLQSRRSSSRDVRGAVTRRQSSKDLRSVLMKRQSSRDIVTDVKDPRLGLLKRESSQNVLSDRFTIRRDSINGLRIVTRDVPDDEDDDTIARLSDISITGDNQQFTRFQLQSLKTHNIFRSRHKVCSLVLDEGLCRKAAEYAEYLANTDTFEHSGDPDNGENLYWSWSSDPRWVVEGEEPVRSWYDESKEYDYTREPVSADTGHFTQLVWSDTTKLGVGVTQSSKTGKFYVVMKYFPPGNYVGRYRQHVLPPLQ